MFLSENYYIVSNPARDTRPNVMGGISLILFIGTLVYLTIVMGINDRMEDELKNEKLRSERLLSEKLLEQKKKAALQTDFSELEKKHADIDHQLINTEALLHRQQLENKDHRREIDRVVSADAKKLATWRKRWTNDSLRYQQQITALQERVADIEAEASTSNMEKEKYREALAHAHETRLHGTSIEARRKKGKRTIKAARTRTIKFAMELADQISDDLSLKIISPLGSTLAIDPSEITVRYDVLILSGDAGPEKRKMVNIVYAPANRLTAGTYEISVFHKGEQLTKFITTLD